MHIKFFYYFLFFLIFICSKKIIIFFSLSPDRKCYFLLKEKEIEFFYFSIWLLVTKSTFVSEVAIDSNSSLDKSFPVK